MQAWLEPGWWLAIELIDKRSLRDGIARLGRRRLKSSTLPFNLQSLFNKSPD